MDEALEAWFLVGHRDDPLVRKSFTENDFREISDILRRSSRSSWCRIPRIYVILRTIDNLASIDMFLQAGLTDLSFPFDQRTLPESIKNQSSRIAFLEAQSLVLTKALTLEKKGSAHGHFADPNEVPLRKLEELGKGAYSYVDRVLSTVSFKEYARKQIPRGRTFHRDRAILRDFERELDILKKLSHLHIVEVAGSYTDPRFVGIIMSPVADCNLKAFLGTQPLLSEGHSFLRTFYGCLANALRYLHENGIRHKDIKPENILVKAHHVYLTDFGISLDWSELSRSTTTGPSSKTLRYCAPEVAANEPRNSSSDIWSLGCVFLEIWSVLCGSSVRDLEEHLTTTGSHSACYYANHDAITTWIQFLRSGSGADSNVPYSWVQLMLQTKHVDRCAAQGLFGLIQETSQNSEQQVLFCGICCIEDDEDFQSESSSQEEYEAVNEVVAPDGDSDTSSLSRVNAQTHQPEDLVSTLPKPSTPNSDEETHLYLPAPCEDKQEVLLDGDMAPGLPVEALIQAFADKSLRINDYLRALLLNHEEWIIDNTFRPLRNSQEQYQSSLKLVALNEDLATQTSITSSLFSMFRPQKHISEIEREKDRVNCVHSIVRVLNTLHVAHSIGVRAINCFYPEALCPVIPPKTAISESLRPINECLRLIEKQQDAVFRTWDENVKEYKLSKFGPAAGLVYYQILMFAKEDSAKPEIRFRCLAGSTRKCMDMCQVVRWALPAYLRGADIVFT